MLQEQQGPRHTEILLRKEDNVGGRKALKEKFVEIFEAFFNDEDPSQGDPKFWEQLFLLKVNIPFLERCIILSSEDRLLVLKSRINTIFTQCCNWLKSSDATRLTHIIEIMSVLLKNIFRKKFSNFGFDVINILCGIDKADTVFPELIKDLALLLKNSDETVKILITNLLNIIATATDFINQNTLLQFFMTVDISHTLLELLGGENHLPKSSQMNVITLLCYLSNFQKYEIQNPYVKSLSNLDDTEKIKQLLDVITEGIKDHNKYFEEQFRQPNLGITAKVGGYLSSWIYTPPVVHNCLFFETGSCLLILYELFYQNETFIKQLVGGGWSREKSCPEILKQFFTFCSYLASDTKESKILYSKISLLILMCISESRELEDYFHDAKSTSYIFIYSKKTLFPDPKELEKHPLSFHVVDILSQFIKCNLKGGNKIQMDTHQLSVDCIQRILSYKKKTQSRLPHKWSDLWSSLFSLLQILPTIQDKSLLNQSIQVGVATVNIFNLFINYGDSFLPTPNDYDDLFYEIIRSGNVVDSFYLFIQQQPQNDPTGALLNSLLNIKSIVQHFSTKLQEWQSANPEVALTAPQVSKVIKENYDTLRLKLQENLDQYNSYVENKEIALFRHYVKELVCDLKKRIVITSASAPGSPPLNK